MTDYQWTLEVDTKGGPRSGNWRHTGLAGIHGGADAGGGLGTIHSWSDEQGETADAELRGMFASWATNLPQIQRDMLKQWVYFGNYEKLNGVLRGQKSIRDFWGDQQLLVERMVPRIDAALESASMPVTISTKRAICDSVKCLETFGSLEPGDEFIDNGYVSTGATNIPEGFDKRRIKANVIIPAGSKAGYLEGTVTERDEYEILIQRGGRFRVIGKQVDDGMITFDLILMAQGDDLPPIPFEPRFAPSLYEGTKADNGGQADKFTWELGDIIIFKKGKKEARSYHWNLEVKGGPGSGHHGHEGRPGMVGGSAPGEGGGAAVDEESIPIKVGYNVSNEEILEMMGPRWQSFEGDVWRGPSRYRIDRDPRKPKSPNVYGDGTYYAMTEEGARTWTDQPEKARLSLDNPLRLDSRAKDEAFREFVRRDTGIEVTYPWPNTRLAERAMTKWLEEQMYDGIVVDYHGAPGGAQAIKIGR